MDLSSFILFSLDVTLRNEHPFFLCNFKQYNFLFQTAFLEEKNFLLQSIIYSLYMLKLLCPNSRQGYRHKQ